MKHTLLHNLTYVTFGLIVALGLNMVSAASWIGPNASSPSGNIAIPLHTGPAQIKDGGLSVDTFLASQNAQFGQQVFFKGMVRGGTPTDSSSTVQFGTGSNATNITATGNVSAVSSISSSSVANTSSSPLCATTNGTIILCTPGATQSGPGPSIVLNSNSYSDQSRLRVEIFQIGSAIAAGNKYTLGVYSHQVEVIAAAGDTPEIIVSKLVAAINATTANQWNDHNSAPSAGTPGFPPYAESVNLGNGDLLKITLNYVNQFGASASAN
ncbi:MAG: hypothetical protein ABIO57_01145 [Candidatus Paceibacterota bacterium]